MGLRLLRLAALAVVWIGSLAAQDLAPRAYVITPVNSNAVNLTYSFYTGGVDFNGTIPITNAQGTYSVPSVSLYHSFKFFGRSANITAGLPYGVGTFSGEALGTDRSIYRSGLLDLSARLSVNLMGGPAMQAKEFGKWKQKRILGASLKMIAPTGQYSPTKLINWGINRWAFKPELGYSQRWGNWILDAYGGVWFYTTNSAFYNIPRPGPQTQEPIGSLEGHLSYDLSRKKTTKKLKPWVSLDGNFWWGGITALSGIQNTKTEQTSSRIGGTFALPFTRHQSLKVSYSDGTYVRFGGNYQNVQVGWQYSWIGTHIR
ncbi:MAG: transporter [Candidatus Korobacteraceae bacterium]